MADDRAMGLFYWRHLEGVARDRKEASGTGSTQLSIKLQGMLADLDAVPTDGSEGELLARRAAWGKWTSPEHVAQFVANRGYEPRYKHSAVSAADLKTGRPYWVRHDYEWDHTKNKNVPGRFVDQPLLQHAIQSSPGVLVSIAKSGGLKSTEERPRVLGQFISGMSSTMDQNKGSANYEAYAEPAIKMANGPLTCADAGRGMPAGGFCITLYVFLRPDKIKQGSYAAGNYQVYVRPEVAAQTSTYSFDSEVISATGSG